ncbi:MAG: site-2 protease family protein [bacterium]|nr:site-2 protease family protein [bacterium]
MTVIIFLLVLSVLVLIHEAGHFIASRFFGVHVEEFGFGFPPRVFGYMKENGRWRRVNAKERGPFKKTVWSVNALPLGGFVRLKGEIVDGYDDADSFHVQSVWKRLIILSAGVIMNWVLAFILFFIVFSVGSRSLLLDLPENAHVDSEQVLIEEVVSDSPAGRAEIPAGAEILLISGVHPTSTSHAQALIKANASETFTMQVSFDGKNEEKELRAEYLPTYEMTGIGVALADVGMVSLPPMEALGASARSVWGYSKMVAVTLAEVAKSFVTRKSSGIELSGPVGIAVISGQVARRGIIPLLEFMAILSVNLAVLNILPIPALDGGRVLFLAIEKMRGRPMSRKVEAVIHNVAFFILIALILIVTAVDISRL